LELDKDAPDSLHKLDKPIRTVLGLLGNDINLHRLVQRLAGDGPDRLDRTVEISARLHEMMRALDEARLAAREAHHPPRSRGRRAGKSGLPVAYRIVAEFWQHEKGAEHFTSNWDAIGPKSPAACFIFAAMRIVVGPDHPRLAEELEYLMTNEIRGLPDRRRGRRPNLR
jgi:hypothetical protein